ncbi:hypothetical protein CRG98_025393 [Punica granatum]|nr:hypothetical protein CRG98_025393 [Punica granatum]
MAEERQGEPSMAAGEVAKRAEGAAHLPRTEPPASSFVGRHRLAASITHLHNQIKALQEELEQLETIGESSIVCRELIPSVESNPDPLLPVTRGPADAGWDRWFRGDNTSRKHKRWI